VIKMNTANLNTDTFADTKVPLEFLVDYTSGAAPEPVALAVATMLDMNPADAKVYAELNEIGGVMLDVQPVPVTFGDDVELTAMLARLADEPQDAGVQRRVRANNDIPFPLQLYVGDSYDSVRWSTVKQGVEEAVLNTGTRGYRTSLLRIAPGKALPLHRHGGLEITVVLDGAYDDKNGRYARGDMEIAGVHEEHQPIADAQTGCLCLAVLSAPLKLSGFIGWFINPFLRV
jgi:putative transcriptional regulator